GRTIFPIALPCPLMCTSLIVWADYHCQYLTQLLYVVWFGQYCLKPVCRVIGHDRVTVITTGDYGFHVRIDLAQVSKGLSPSNSSRYCQIQYDGIKTPPFMQGTLVDVQCLHSVLGQSHIVSQLPDKVPGHFPDHFFVVHYEDSTSAFNGFN